MVRLIATCCVASLVSTCAADSAPVVTFDGVPDIDASCWVVFQDRSDHYWFGSDGRGLFRYDGKALTHFTTADGLCNDHVRGIQQHASGDLLITTLGGVSRFDGRRFVTLPVAEMTNPTDGWALDPDDVWLPFQPMQKGPYRYDGKTLYHLRFPKSPREDAYFASSPNLSWSPYEIYCVYKDRRGSMWFGTANLGICRYDGKSHDWMYENHLTQLAGDRMFGIRSIIEDDDGAFWFCNTRYRFRIGPRTASRPGPGSIEYTRETGIDLGGVAGSDQEIYFQSVVIGENGHLWMATFGFGVWEFDGKKLTHHRIEEDGKTVQIVSISKDNHGELWLGTHAHGAYRFDGATFRKFRP